MDIKAPKTALYVVGGLVLLMGVWGFAAIYVDALVIGDVVDPVWHAVLKVVLGAYALWVAAKA